MVSPQYCREKALPNTSQPPQRIIFHHDHQEYIHRNKESVRQEVFRNGKLRYLLHKEKMQGFQRLEKRMSPLSPSHVLTTEGKILLELLIQMCYSQSLAAAGFSLSLEWLMICFWSFFTLKNSYIYARHFNCTFLQAICCLQPTAITQLGSQPSFLPTKLVTLSALVPDLAQKTGRKTNQWWTKRCNALPCVFMERRKWKENNNWSLCLKWRVGEKWLLGTE